MRLVCENWFAHKWRHSVDILRGPYEPIVLSFIGLVPTIKLIQFRFITLSN